MPNHAGALQGRFFPAKLETEGDDAIFNTLLNSIVENYANAIDRQLNDRPNKCLDFETPAEVLAPKIMNLQPGAPLHSGTRHT